MTVAAAHLQSASPRGLRRWLHRLGRSVTVLYFSAGLLLVVAIAAPVWAAHWLVAGRKRLRAPADPARAER